MAPDAIVKTALSENLALIAITDHNEITNVAAAIKAATGTSLVVVPGVELTTPEGQLLVYFETLNDLTGCLGKLNFAGHGTADSRCQTSLLECLKAIDPSKGFAVLAHVDGGAGLEEKVVGYPPHKADINSLSRYCWESNCCRPNPRYRSQNPTQYPSELNSGRSGSSR